MIRVISGIAKGRKLKTPKGRSIRITSDKVKGAIFNILGSSIIGVKILDLFSGTGSLGIEALSRGAETAVFVESDNTCLQIIKENLASVGFEGDFIKGDVYKILGKLEGRRFDVVFADPPYEKSLAKNLLLELDKCNILANSSIVAIEHSKRESVKESVSFSMLKEGRYGDTIVSIYKYKK